MNILALNLIIMLANLGVLGLTVKLYTEFVKDRRFSKKDDAR